MARNKFPQPFQSHSRTVTPRLSIQTVLRVGLQTQPRQYARHLEMKCDSLSTPLQSRALIQRCRMTVKRVRVRKVMVQG